MPDRRKADEQAMEQPCVSALACVALVVPLTACEGQLPTPAADTSTKVAPDLTEAQEKKIWFIEDSQDDR